MPLKQKPLLTCFSASVSSKNSQNEIVVDSSARQEHEERRDGGSAAPVSVSDEGLPPQSHVITNTMSEHPEQRRGVGHANYHRSACGGMKKPCARF